MSDDLTQTRSHNQANEITEISETVGGSWPTPSYDPNGNTTSFPSLRACAPPPAFYQEHC
jgi:hypothetical protein